MDPAFWYFLDGVASAVACLVTLYYGFPAYKRTKQAGFLFWCFSALGSLWNTVMLRTIGSDPYTNRAAHLFVHQSYRVLFIVDAVLGAIGTVLVVNGYLSLFESKTPDAAASQIGDAGPIAPADAESVKD